MSTPQENMYREALSAIHAGDRARARDLLTRLLKTSQDNAEYWVWMSAVVDTHKERTFCLNEALKLDPQNTSARRGLTLLGVLPPEQSLILPARFHKRNWMSKLLPEEEAGKKPVPRYQMAAMGIAAVLVIALISAGIFYGARQRLNSTGPLRLTFNNTPTSAVMAAEVTRTQVRPTGSPTPLWMGLKATYTPTPLYVNTLHPQYENFRTGMRAYQRGDWAGAVKNFEIVFQYDKNAADVLYYMGESYRQQGNQDKAIDAFTRAIKLSPNFAPPYVGRALAKVADNPKAGKNALADLETAVEKDSSFGEAYLALASIQLQMDQPEKALEALESAAQLLPDSPMVYLSRAQVYLAMGKTDLALADARKANQLDVTMLEAYRMIGEVLQTQGDRQGALGALNTYLAYKTDDPEAWVWIAKAYYDGGEQEKALNALDKALKLNNNRLDSHLMRGELLLAQKKYDKALDDFETALNIDKESFDAVMGKGRALMGMDSRGAVGTAYNQFEAAKPLAETEYQTAERLYWLALSLEKMGYLDTAIKDWQAILAMPKGAVDAEWSAYAQKRLSELITATFTPPPKTLTPTITSTSTRWPTKTITPTATRKPTKTATPSRTPAPSPTRTPSPSPTRKP